MISKRNLPYYVISTIIILIMLFITPCVRIGDTAYSISEVIATFTDKQINDGMISCRKCLEGIRTYWLYIIMSVSVVIPAVQYTMYEIKSRFFMNVQFRQNRTKYILSRMFGSMICGLICVLGAVLVYYFVVLLYIPLNPQADNVIVIDTVEDNVLSILEIMTEEFIYIVIYGMMMSAFGVLCIFIIQDVMVDLSLVFICSYFTASIFLENNYYFPIAAIVVMIIFCRILWKYMEERI